MENTSFCSVVDVNDQIRQAQDVDFTAYLLDHAVETALSAAAAHGAHVHVRLSAISFGSGKNAILQRNTAAVERLCSLGVDAALVQSPVLHLKAAVVDGVSYFDDRNWSAGDTTVLRDADPVVAAALVALRCGEPVRDGALALHKITALSEEQGLLRSQPRATLKVASETLGPCSLTKFLAQRAAHQPVELVVDARTLSQDEAMQREVAVLQAAGVTVRATASTEKMALAGDAAWFGSANATAANPNSLDFGCAVQPVGMRHQLAVAFAALWAKAHVVESGPPSDHSTAADGEPSPVSGRTIAERVSASPMPASSKTAIHNVLL